ncbi:hypothetical protein SRHO_G00313530 [Serrasalmus rhombeus]
MSGSALCTLSLFAVRTLAFRSFRHSGSTESYGKKPQDLETKQEGEAGPAHANRPGETTAVQRRATEPPQQYQPKIPHHKFFIFPPRCQRNPKFGAICRFSFPPHPISTIPPGENDLACSCVFGTRASTGRSPENAAVRSSASVCSRLAVPHCVWEEREGGKKIKTPQRLARALALAKASSSFVTQQSADLQCHPPLSTPNADAGMLATFRGVAPPDNALSPFLECSVPICQRRS